MKLMLRARMPKQDDRGQVLVLAALMVLAMSFVAALLYDGAQLLVNRRVLQNAADTGAMAGANIIQNNGGCNGTVQSTAVTAATAHVNAAGMLSGSPTYTAICPSGYGNHAVRVTINGTSPSFFGSALRMVMDAASAASWTPGIPVTATGTAIHGPMPGMDFNVVELNPHNPSWQSGLRGCPSILFSGNANITFEGNVHANSECPAASGGAMSTNGGPTVTFLNNSRASLSGGYSATGIAPYPLTFQPKLRDPLRGLPPVPISSLPVRSNSQLTINGTTAVLQPGLYRGGIRLLSTAVVFLLPGIYAIDGGGLNIGSQAAMMTIPSSLATACGPPTSIICPSVPPTTVATWASNCSFANCGVLIYNYNASRSQDAITVGGGATLLLRPYQHSIDLTPVREQAYNWLLIWQDRSPEPTSNYIQPPVNLNGGGTINISGTLYAPSAKVFLTGGSGGSGGDSLNLTLQFISWDLQIQGNSSFYFHYSVENFARPLQYGLVE